MNGSDGPDLSALPGADLVGLDASEAAARAGLAPGWLLFRRVAYSAEGTYSRWTASRGRKPLVWAYLPLRLGLSSTLAAPSLDVLRAETARMEWLGTVYVVSLALTRTAARLALIETEG